MASQTLSRANPGQLASRRRRIRQPQARGTAERPDDAPRSLPESARDALVSTDLNQSLDLGRHLAVDIERVAPARHLAVTRTRQHAVPSRVARVGNVDEWRIEEDVSDRSLCVDRGEGTVAGADDGQRSDIQGWRARVGHVDVREQVERAVFGERVDDGRV